MKKYLLLATIASSTFAFNANAAYVNSYDSTASSARISPYISAKLKYAIMDNSANMKFGDDMDSYNLKFNADDNVLAGSVAAGMSIPLIRGTLRSEIEYNKNADAEKTNHVFGYDFKAKVESQSLLLNAYYDFDTGTRLIPYIGAGIGGAKIKASLDGEGIDDTVLTWQIGAGAAYAITDNLSLDAGYRFINYDDFSEEETDAYWWEKDTVESKAHEIYVGLRYNF